MIENYPLPDSPVAIPPSSGQFSLMDVAKTNENVNHTHKALVKDALNLQQFFANLGYFDTGIIAVNTVINGPVVAPMVPLYNIGDIDPNTGEFTPMATAEWMEYDVSLYLQIWMPTSTSKDLTQGQWEDAGAILNQLQRNITRANYPGGLVHNVLSYLQDHGVVMGDLMESDAIHNAIATTIVDLWGATMGKS